jgi:hypothetical protein
VGVVHKSGADGVGESGVSQIIVPVGGGELAGDDGGAQAVAVLEDFEQIAVLLVAGAAR